MSANATTFTPQRQAKAIQMRKRFEYFAASCVKIEGVDPGSVYQFIVNRAQLYLLAAMYKMIKEVGYVRIIIVKGRQQGISTLIEMFLFWLALFVPNTKVCIISHEAASSAALFQKVEFAYNNLPQGIKPQLKASSRGKELVLENDSRYMVLTAGSEESGRSQTAHHQHQSERAFFVDPEAIDAGAGQIVREVAGTYVFKESTGNGMNHFQQETMDALAGKGVYRVVFIPWYWEQAYRTVPKKDFVRDDYEQRLVDIYKIDDWQLQWRRNKIVELKSLRKFRQEYPFSIQEAFQASGNSFYDPDLVAKARASTLVSDYGPLVLGVDPGRTGDRTVLVLRRGRQVIQIWKYDAMETMRLAGIVSGLIDKWNIDKVFIDWGMGHGTIDRLHELNYRSIVTGVHFGGAADDDKIYLNKRAEMAFRFRDWLADGEVRLPDDDDMAADIASMPEDTPTSNGRIKFPTKDEIRKTLLRSPDILDAIMATFAYHVRAVVSPDERSDMSSGAKPKMKSGLTTRQRVLSGDTEDVAYGRVADYDGPTRIRRSR